MTEIKHIIDIFPNELLIDIQNTVSKFPYNCADGTVEHNSSPTYTNKHFLEFISTINTIQDINPNICLLYNDYHDGNNNTLFSSIEGSQIFEAFKAYLPTEFDGYKLKRLHVNKTLAHPDYPLDRYTIPHYDSPDNTLFEYKTILFYVNTSDGNTILFDKFGDSTVLDKSSELNLSNMNLQIIHEQYPVENSALIYSSRRLHAHRPNKNSKHRFVINIVLEKI